MSGWSYTTPPTWFPTAVVSAGGWKNPDTNELLVAIGNLEVKNTDATTLPTIVGVTVNNEALTTGGTLVVVVEFSEPVAVLGSPTIDLLVSGGGTRKLTFDSAMSTATLLAFDYTVVEADSAVAGDVTVGTEIGVTTGDVYDVLPGGGLSKITDTISFTAPATNLVTFN